MLTGRESLIRLIGKRRRFLPNRESVLQQSSIQSSLSTRKDDEQSEIFRDKLGENLAEKSDFDKVTCPVCGNRIRGEDYMINSHLDACLARGTKRKLSQRTLLQLNFCPRPKVQIDSVKPECLETSHASDDKERANSIKYGLGENTCIKCESSDLPSTDVLHRERTSSVEISVSDDTVSYSNEFTVSGGGKVGSPLLLPESKMCTSDDADLADDIVGKVLATFIVGRRFNEEMELKAGSSIFLCREPDNSKDPNAIKVCYAESECCKMLGFIPRELAQYLSELMDVYGLKFEGNITSIPANSHAIVPIQICCQEKILFGEQECERHQVFKSLCRNALSVVQSNKIGPHGMMKYQQNFLLLLKEVLSTYPQLFTSDEKTFLEKFISLSDDSQRLFVRLYTRKGPWFRVSNISYTEILDCVQAVKELSAGGYVCSIETMSELHKVDIEGILNVLGVGELREMLCFNNKKCSRSSRKQDLIASLLSLYDDGSCPSLQRMILEKIGACIRISSTADSLVWRAERLFFLNGEQDLSAFLLVDLGVIKYPAYNCIILDQIFSSRDDLLSYEEALEVAQIMDELLDENNTVLTLKLIDLAVSRMPISSSKAIQTSTSESIAASFTCFSASWIYSKVVLLGVSFLEHETRYSDAIDLLKCLLLNFTSDRRRGYWTLRLSIDLEHVGRLNESLSVAENGLLDPWIRAGSRVSLQRRVLRLGKPPRRWKIPRFSESIKRKIPEVHVQGRPLNCRTGAKSRFYGEDGEQCGVEELALQYYSGEGGGWQGVHTESGIWLTLFGILMWDTVFADVPNVFRTRFQTSPLDLDGDSFYQVRKDIIETLLQKIQGGMAEEILITSWESHVGTACRGVNWDKHSLSELRAVTSCIGGPCLASICRHLAQDYRSWSSGMPDLLLWRFHGDYSGEAKLVEVKGPRDRLSEQQRAWLLFLMDSGFNAEVCRVSPPIAK